MMPDDKALGISQRRPGGEKDPVLAKMKIRDPILGDLGLAGQHDANILAPKLLRGFRRKDVLVHETCDGVSVPPDDLGGG